MAAWIFAVVFVCLYTVGGLLCAVVGTVGINFFEDKVHQRWAREAEIVTVVIANRDIGVGETVSESDLIVLEVSPSSLPEGVFSSFDGVVGQTVSEPLLPNEIVRTERLTP